jgi:uncharacterized repeat protein (TIGR02543 family)
MKNKQSIVISVMILAALVLTGCENPFFPKLKTVETFTVNFDTEDGSPINPVEIESGETITLPEAPTKTGFMFAGWYTEEERTNEFDEVSPITKDITLYVKWLSDNDNDNIPNSEDPDVDGDGVPNSEDPDVDNDEKPNGADDDIDGDGKLNDEDDDADGDGLPDEEEQEEEPETFTVTFNTNGGSSVPDKTGIASGDTITLPDEPTKSGFIFKGWYTDEACTEAFDESVPISANITLYAKWEAVAAGSFVVNFVTNGGSAVASQSILSGGKVTMPEAPTKAGYSFDAWYKESTLSTAWDFDKETVSAMMTLYAKWTLNQYTVSFNADGGMPAPQDQIITHGLKATEPEPTKTGFTLMGWYNGDVRFDFSAAITSNLTLKAKWEVMPPNTHVVKFIPDGGTPVPENQIIAHGEKAEEPAVNPTKTGYDFKGWYNGAELFNFNTAITSDINLTAKWELKTYTVTFNADGGTPAPGNQTIDHGEKVTKPAIDPTKTGNNFLGWYKGDELFDFNTAITCAFSLTAKWELKTYTITFNADGGTPAPSETPADYGRKITEPAAMSKTNYAFDGWYTEDDTLWNFSQDTVSGTITLYAKWTRTHQNGEFTITFDQIDDGTPVVLTKTLSRSGAGGLEQSATLSFEGDYTDIAWSGYGLESDTSEFKLTLDKEESDDLESEYFGRYDIDFDLAGTHLVYLSVKKGGVPYIATIIITVEE